MTSARLKAVAVAGTVGLAVAGLSIPAQASTQTRTGSIVNVPAATAAATPSVSTPDSSRLTLTYKVTKGGTVTGPTKTAPGRVVINVVGPNAIELFRPHSAKVGLTTLATDVAKSTKNDFISHDFYWGGGNYDSAFVVNLKPGKYYVVSGDTSGKYTIKGAKILVVTGKTVNLAPPTTTGTILETGVRGFTSVPTSLKNTGYVTIRNSARGIRRPTLIQVKTGTTLAQVKAFWTGASTVNPFLSEQLGSGTQSPGATTSVAYKLPSGTYVLFDFLDATLAGAHMVTLHA